METFVTAVKEVYEWSVERTDTLKSDNRHKDALAIHEEFKEWIQADYDNETEVIVIEKLEDLSEESENDYLRHING
jgi:uncharacterized protein YktA (UPF0223 family)